MIVKVLAPTITIPGGPIPTRINSNGNTLIDNMSTNSILPDKCSENLSVGISNHLPLLILIPLENKQHKHQKLQYKRAT